MAALTAGLAALTVAGTANQFITQRREAKAAEQMGDYEAQLYGMNAEFAELQAEDAIARGRESEFRSRAGTRQLVGAQRVALAAQGISLDTGSPADVIENDMMLGELDALTIRNNARREAWGFQAQAAQYRAHGDMARWAGKRAAKSLRNQSVSTLLSGAGNLFSIYQSYGKTSGSGG